MFDDQPSLVSALKGVERVYVAMPEWTADKPAEILGWFAQGAMKW